MNCSTLSGLTHDVLAALSSGAKAQRTCDGLARKTQLDSENVRLIVDDLILYEFVERVGQRLEARIPCLHERPGADPVKAARKVKAEKRRPKPKLGAPVIPPVEDWYPGDAARYLRRSLSEASWAEYEVEFNQSAVAKQISEMMTFRKMGMVTIKQMIDEFTKTDHYMYKGLPAWRCFLGNRKTLVQKVKESAPEAVSGGAVGQTLVTASMLLERKELLDRREKKRHASMERLKESRKKSSAG